MAWLPSHLVVIIIIIIIIRVRSSRCGRFIFVQADFVDFVLFLSDKGCFSCITKLKRLLQIELIYSVFVFELVLCSVSFSVGVPPFDLRPLVGLSRCVALS